MNNSLLAEIYITFLSIFICGQARGCSGLPVDGRYHRAVHEMTLATVQLNERFRGIKNTFSTNKFDRSSSKISVLLCCFEPLPL
jgi:hypothetical protein